MENANTFCGCRTSEARTTCENYGCIEPCQTSTTKHRLAYTAALSINRWRPICCHRRNIYARFSYPHTHKCISGLFSAQQIDASRKRFRPMKVSCCKRITLAFHSFSLVRDLYTNISSVPYGISTSLLTNIITSNCYGVHTYRIHSEKLLKLKRPKPMCETSEIRAFFCDCLQLCAVTDAPMSKISPQLICNTAIVM